MTSEPNSLLRARCAVWFYFALAAVACVANSAFAQTTPPRAESSALVEYNSYEPVVVFGSNSAKNKILFFWSADEASRRFYKAHIRPLFEKAKTDSTIRVAFIQQPIDDKVDLRGPGALMFCADTGAQYAKVALEYLTFPFDVNRRYRSPQQPTFYVNDNIQKVFSSNGIDIEKCVSSKRFSDQLLRYGAASELALLTLKGSAPLVVYNQRQISQGDRAGLAQLSGLVQK